jgi:hypothetical protein
MGGCYTNVRYAERSDRNVLDIALPNGPTRPPLVVFIHGGAFFMGDKTDFERERTHLLTAGFAVASVNYRYSVQAIWPAQLDDLKSAFAFLRAHADDYGYDGQRMASFGPSAGGHLSASIGIRLAADPATALDASVIWFPPVDFPTMDADIIATGVARATGPGGRGLGRLASVDARKRDLQCPANRRDRRRDDRRHGNHGLQAGRSGEPLDRGHGHHYLAVFHHYEPRRL